MNPYEAYQVFRDRSTSLNRALYTVRDRWDEVGVPASFDDASRFSHLVMFLSEVIAFEAFMARCLRDECGLAARQMEKMGIEMMIRVLLPGAGRDSSLPDTLKKVHSAFGLRNTWMHGCGDPDLTVSKVPAKKKAKGDAVPMDIFEAAEWVDGSKWSETACVLTDIAGRIAERFGWKAASGGTT